jgi:NAD-dependent DNA ligase
MIQTLISDIDLIGNQTAAHLYDAGYTTLEDVREATAEELIDVEGVGVGKLGKLIALDRDKEVPA